MMLPQGTPSMSFPDSIRICMQGFCNCEGRARRSEFWWFYMLCCIISIFLSFFLGIGGVGYVIFYLIVNIVLYIPIISASTRRLHDIGMSGLYNLIMLIPFGVFVLMYFWSIDSHRINNIYGPSVKYPVGSAQTDPLLINPQAPVISVSPIAQPVGYTPVQPMVYPGQQPIPVSPNVYPAPQQNIPVAQPNAYPEPQQNIPVAQPNAYPEPQQNIPVAQQNAYPEPQQNIPVAQPNTYPQPQQNIPVAQPNAVIDKPSAPEGGFNYPQNDVQYQAPMVPPPQNPPNY